MEWQTKPNHVYLELVTSWLRAELEKLSHCLLTIERSRDYHDQYVQESIKTAEIALRQIRKFIAAN